MKLGVELREGVRIALSALWANRLRSLLATLGVVIGVVTVTLMATALEGLRTSFLRSVSALGSDVLYVEKFPWDSPVARWRLRNRPDFTVRDAAFVARESREALAVSVEASGGYPVQAGDRSADTVWVVGNNEHSALVRQLTVKTGRFLSAAEVAGNRPVCVLGAEMAERFFPDGDAVGRRLRVNHSSYEVVGVLDKFGPFLFANMDSQVIVPITRFVSDFQRQPYVLLMVKVRDAARMDEAREELRGVVRRLRGVEPGASDDFAINQQETLLRTFRRVGGIIASVGLFVTGLSLFVGGIGIMNIMFVSVAERTREIGIRKAIGARRRTILIQFLLEAAAICLAGGMVALALSWALTLLLARHLPVSLSFPVAGLALGVSAFTGVVAGLLPAWRAARLQPVDALRAE